jgi:hypothetical protein
MTGSCSNGTNTTRAACCWVFVMCMLALALAGPSLTGQHIPTLVKIRHEMLMLDREFERLSLRAHTSSVRTATQMFNDERRGRRSRAPAIPSRIGTS